jgi:ParB family chromosome partitioning protein
MAGLPADAANDLAARRARRNQKNLIEETEVKDRLTVALRELAPHPDNPREDDPENASEDQEKIESIAQSMRSLGVLEPLVVTTREAHLEAHPHHAEQIGRATYVVVAGHRRMAAAKLAELKEVPIEVRPDLSKDGRDFEVMAVENFHRAGLKPLEEAAVFAKLASLGRSQRQIAARTGFSQSHISKRIALLTLPDPVRQAVASGKLYPADALELAKLDNSADQLAAWKLVTDKGLTAADAVARQRDLAAVAARIAEAQQRAANEQLPVVDPDQLSGPLAERRLSDESAIAEAKSTGHLAIVIGNSGSFDYVTTAEPKPEPEPEPDPAEDEAQTGQKPSVPAQTTRPSKKEEAAERAAAVEAQERKNAGQARELACARIASRKQLAPEVLRRVAAAAVSLGLDARALKLAHRWLRAASIGPEQDDPHAFAAVALDAQDGLAQRLAYAMALAADELRVQRMKEWDAAAATHLRRLMADAEHSPTDWERQQLEAAEGATEEAAASA